MAERTSWSVGPPSQTLVCSRSTAPTTTLAASGSAHCSIRAAAPPGPTVSPGSGSSAIASRPAVPAPSGARVSAGSLPVSPRLSAGANLSPSTSSAASGSAISMTSAASGSPPASPADTRVTCTGPAARSSTEISSARPFPQAKETPAVAPATDADQLAGIGRRRDGAGKACGLPGRGQRLREPGRCEPLERSRLPQRAQLRDVAGERRVAGPAVEVERLGDRQRRLDDRGVGVGSASTSASSAFGRSVAAASEASGPKPPEVRQQVDPREPGPAHGRRGAEGDLAAVEADLDLEAPGDRRQRDVRHDPPAGCQVPAAVDWSPGARRPTGRRRRRSARRAAGWWTA